MNRLITSLVQLSLLGATLPLAYAVYRDIRENGFMPDED